MQRRDGCLLRVFQLNQPKIIGPITQKIDRFEAMAHAVLGIIKLLSLKHALKIYLNIPFGEFHGYLVVPSDLFNSSSYNRVYSAAIRFGSIAA